MAKLPNRVLLNSVPALNEINQKKLPVRTAFKIVKVSRAVEETLKDYYTMLKALQEKHAELDDKGKMVTKENTIVMKDQEAFQEEFEELLNLDVDLKIDKISLNELDSVQVEPHFLYHLDWLLEE